MRSTIIRSLPGFLLLTFTLATRAQTFTSMALQQEYSARAERYTNGYASAIRCEEWGYDNLWNDRTEAMITRASNGQMVMEWVSDPVKRIDGLGARFLFLACADQSEQPRSFDLWVDDRPCGAITNRPGVHWEQSTPEGIVFTFSAYDRNQWGDRMGFLEVLVPGRLVEIGKPVRFRLIGEKAESNTYFMIFKNRELLEEITARAAVEELFEITGTEKGLEVSAGVQWAGRTARWVDGNGSRPIRFVRSGDKAVGRVDTDGGEPDGALLWQGKKVFEIDGIRDSGPQYGIDGDLLTVTSHQKEGIRISRQRTEAGMAFDRLAGGDWENAQIHIMVSSHQDIAWVDSPYNCIEARDKLIVTPALELLARYPDYRYDIEDALILEEYLERHPDKRSEIAGYIASGRLGIGASYTQPYEEIQSGEALVRQFYFGKRRVEEEFPGAQQRTYWNVDVPGRTLQMPQILDKCGVDHLMYSRHQAGIYDWLSPDGSSVRVYTPGHYTRAAQFLHKNIYTGINKFLDFLEEFPDYRQTKEQPRVIGMLSAEDMSQARTYYDWIDGMRREADKRGVAFPTLSHSTADRFMDSLSDTGGEYPRIMGERPDLWQYIHSATHADAFADYKAATALLPQAELFSTALAAVTDGFARYPKEEIDAAWKAVIYPDHGWGGNRGNITDSLFAAKYRFAKELAGKVLDRTLEELSANIRTARRKGTPVVVYNSTSWERPEVVRISARELPYDDLSVLKAVDGTGNECALQVHGECIEVAAEALPAMGYATLYLKPGKGKTDKGDRTPCESPYYRLVFQDGMLMQIIDKESGEALFDTSHYAIGDVIALRSVGNGAGEFSTMQRPTADHLELASEINPRWELVETGPVYTLYRSVAPFENARIIRTLRLYKGLKRIDFDTEIQDFDGTRYLEYRQLFPLTAAGAVSYSVPFGEVRVGRDEMKGAPGERYQDEAKDIHPRTVTGWIMCKSTGSVTGIATSAALVDYLDPIHPDNDKTILQPVLLASRRSCHPQGEFYSQCGTHRFHIAFSSEKSGHSLDLVQRLEAAQTPVHAVVAPRQWIGARLAPSGSFFSVGNDRVAVSTIKKAEDSDRIVLRVYNRGGRTEPISFTSDPAYGKIRPTDMLERISDDRRDATEIPPYAIETFLIE